MAVLLMADSWSLVSAHVVLGSFVSMQTIAHLAFGGFFGGIIAGWAQQWSWVSSICTSSVWLWSWKLFSFFVLFSGWWATVTQFVRSLKVFAGALTQTDTQIPVILIKHGSLWHLPLIENSNLAFKLTANLRCFHTCALYFSGCFSLIDKWTKRTLFIYLSLWFD